MQPVGGAVIGPEYGTVILDATEYRRLATGGVSPCPGITKPQRGDQMKFCGIGSAVASFYTNADIFSVSLGVFHEHIEVAVILEDARVEQFKFRPTAFAPAILVDELSIGKLLLRVLVQHLHVAVRGCVVEIKVILFYVLTAVAFRRGQSKVPLLEDRISSIP